MNRLVPLTAAALALQAGASPEAAFAQPAAAPIVAPAVPRADPQSLIRPDDYPASARQAGEQGSVRFALDVGSNGRVGGCTILWSSGSAALDSATCRIARSRSRFTPARDATGQPAPGRVEQEVVWTLPPTAGGPPRVEARGYGMVANSISPQAVVTRIPGFVPEPIMAIPQDGPGEAELSVWTPGSKHIPTLGRFPSIPDCRRAKARLRLKGGQKAYCTLAPVIYPDLGIH